MPEKRLFKMHQNLLMDVIKRQAGSIEKAWLEAIMNSIDAGAKHIDITITEDSTTIKDDGRGMGRDEVLKYFEVFGQPQEEKKTFGEFRMGRGQLFAHGVNTWRTNGLKMVVDVERHGLEYLLDECSDHYAGCEIVVEHYQKLEQPNLKAATLREWTMYVSAKVTVNGEQIESEYKSKTYESENAKYYIQVGEGELILYNQGVRVMRLSQFGIRGAVVSKKPLKVNFARNEAMDSCPVWQSIKKEAVVYALEMFYGRKRLPEIAKKWLSDLIVRNEFIRHRFANCPVIRTSSGGWVSLAQISDVPVFFAPKGNKLADRIMQRELAVAIDDEYISIKELIKPDNLKTLQDFVKNPKINKKTATVDEGVLTEEEKKKVGWLRTWNDRYIGSDKRRNIEIGTGNPRAWTDGSTYIVINREELTTPYREWVVTLPTLLIHEYCHDDNNDESDVHGEVFYEKFHEMMFELAPMIFGGMNKIVYGK